MTSVLRKKKEMTTGRTLPWKHTQLCKRQRIDINSTLLPHFSSVTGQAKSLQFKQLRTVRKFRSKLLQARPFLIIFIASLNLLCCAISSDLINSLQGVCHVQSLTDVWFQALRSQSPGSFPSTRRPLALRSWALLSFKKDFILMELYYWEICCTLAWASFYAFIL